MILPKMQLSGVPGLVVKTQKFATTYSRAQYEATNAAALTAKRAILFVAPKQLRNVKRKGNNVKLGVGYDIKTYGAIPTALVKARPRGLWAIVERGAKPHNIGFSKVSRRRGGGETSKLIAFADGSVVRGPLKHPGRSGSHPFQKGAEASKPAVKKAYETALTKSLAQTFGV